MEKKLQDQFNHGSFTVVNNLPRVWAMQHKCEYGAGNGHKYKGQLNMGGLKQQMFPISGQLGHLCDGNHCFQWPGNM